MADAIETLYVQQYTSNMELLLQQKQSKLSGFTMTSSPVGKQAAVVDQFGSVAMKRRTGRFEELTPESVPTDRRWVLPADYDLTLWIDTFDKLRLLQDPAGPYSQDAVAAANRTKDDIIIAAFFDTAKTGETGGTSTSFLSGNQIAVNYGAGANTGLTVAKIKEAQRLLLSHEVDLEAEQPYIAITSKQSQDLLNETEIINLDYSVRPVLTEGRITRFLGFNFVYTERLTLDTNSYRRIPVWVKSGMHLGVWKDQTTSVDKIVTKSGHPWQLYMMYTMGATRTQEKKVLEIKCSEA